MQAKSSLQSKKKRLYRAVLIGFLLALMTLALYWPVQSFDFVNYDDRCLCNEQPPGSGRSSRGRDQVVFYKLRCGHLAAACLAVAHAGLPIVRNACRRASLDERADPYGQCAPAFFRFITHDALALGKRARGSALCRPPPPRGIGCLGLRSGRTSSAGSSGSLRWVPTPIM